MATLKQIAANRRNAQRSTGPVTPEGKSASSQNALRSGIYAAVEAVLPDEDPKDLASLAAEYHSCYKPKTPAERCLVDCLVSDEWLLRRFRRIEAGLFAEYVEKITGETRSIGEAYGMTDSTLERLQRRINATRRSYLKTLQTLESLRVSHEVATQTPVPAPNASPKAAPQPSAPAVQPQVNGPLPAPIGFVPSSSLEGPSSPAPAVPRAPQATRD